MKTKLEVTVDEKMVQEALHSALATTLSDDMKERIVNNVIQHALTTKKNSYDRETVFQQQVSEAIRIIAKDEIAAWVDEQRPKIRKAIKDVLAKYQIDDLEQKVATALATALAKDLSVSVWMPSEKY